LLLYFKGDKTFEDLINNIIESDDIMKSKIRDNLLKIIDSEKFTVAMEKHIFDTIKNMDIEDILYDLIHEEDVFRPIVISIKKRLSEMLN